MKRKTIEEVMKMTKKGRFFYYARLVHGHKNFSVSTTPKSNVCSISVWNYLSRYEFDYKCMGNFHVNIASDIVSLEKYLDKWL